MKILIVETIPTSHLLLENIRKDMDIYIHETDKGYEALSEISSKNPPGIVILEQNIRDINTLELVQKIREGDLLTGRYTYIIMIRSDGSYNDIDTYIPAPIDRTSMEISIKAALRILEQHEKLNTTRLKLEKQLQSQKKEIMKAQEIQQILNTSTLPQPEYLSLEAVNNPSHEIGGDFFNVFLTPSNHLATIMVDCTGHGLEASMYATLLKSICDRHTSLLDNPQYLSTFVQMVNIDVADYITSDQFPVMFVSVYNNKEHKFYYSSANGEHPYLIRDKKTHKLANCPGMHLGYNTESQYQIKSFMVAPGDRILFYSDAIIEIPEAPWNRRKDEFLTKKLAEDTSNMEEYKNNIMKFINDYAGDTVLNDDLSLIFMEINNPYRYSNKLWNKSEINKEINKLSDLLTGYNYKRDEIDQSLIAAREMLLNAFIHGNQNDSRLSVSLEYIINFKEIKIVIEDNGDGFTVNDIPDPTNPERLLELYNKNDEAYGQGRGIWLAGKLSSKLIYSNGGRKVTIIKRKNAVKTSNNYKIPVN